MAITVQLHLGLARFHPHLETGRAVPVKVPPGSTVEWVVGRTCGLDTAIRPLVTVNGQPSSLAEQVHEGDRVRLFLPLSGG